MTLEQYIDNIDKRYKLGNATEHTFRGDLQQLLESLMPTIRATNEPKRQRCGAPDYILTKKDIPVGFIEAKDIGDKDLDGTKKTGNKEQFDRYKASLNNLIFTDYINFHLYREGEFITKIAIAELIPSSSGGAESYSGLKPLPENFERFENLIKDFCSHIGQTIKSPKKLAEMMAGKARLLSDIIGKALTSDEEHRENSTLKDQMLAFRKILIHTTSPLKVLQMSMPKPLLTGCLPLVCTTLRWIILADRKQQNSFQSQTPFCENSLATLQDQTLTTVSNG